MRRQAKEVLVQGVFERVRTRRLFFKCSNGRPFLSVEDEEPNTGNTEANGES